MLNAPCFFHPLFDPETKYGFKGQLAKKLRNKTINRQLIIYLVGEVIFLQEKGKGG